MEKDEYVSIVAYGKTHFLHKKSFDVLETSGKLDKRNQLMFYSVIVLEPFDEAGFLFYSRVGGSPEILYRVIKNRFEGNVGGIVSRDYPQRVFSEYSYNLG
jgi:hypothetical protein